jgi:hypothetical protein
MKRVLLVLIVLALGSSVFAQSRPQDVSNITVRTVPIIKIYSHQLGYKVYYITTRGEVSSFYLPVEWFNVAGGKGVLSYGSGPQYPYMSIYWVDKKFSHIKLFLIENPMSDSWGVLRDSPAEAADKFKVEEPKLE